MEYPPSYAVFVWKKTTGEFYKDGKPHEVRQCHYIETAMALVNELQARGAFIRGTKNKRAYYPGRGWIDVEDKERH